MKIRGGERLGVVVAVKWSYVAVFDTLDLSIFHGHLIFFARL